ncbi:MAG: DUF7144 family membrane protein [Carbonactinosporaceae bacterium]
MAQMPQAAGPPGDQPRSLRVEEVTTGWVGWVLFAGVVMILIGFFHVIAGIAALLQEDYFLVGQNDMLVDVDFTSWGWAHLALGVVVFLVGVGILAGQTWARMLGILFAVVSAIVSLGFLAAYPLWSILIIALDIVVIYSLAVHGREVKALRS